VRPLSGNRTPIASGAVLSGPPLTTHMTTRKMKLMPVNWDGCLRRLLATKGTT
jgi:hypothetical protein